jgi:hypothetical protein
MSVVESTHGNSRTLGTRAVAVVAALVAIGLAIVILSQAGHSTKHHTTAAVRPNAPAASAPAPEPGDRGAYVGP